MPGTTDTVKAILTPGEFVIRKEAVDMIGAPILERINDMPEKGGHSSIDRLIQMATMSNMKAMYGGGMVNAGPKPMQMGGMAEEYGHGGMVKDQMMMMAKGGQLKPVPEDNPGLAKLPEKVRNRMGYMQNGGMVEDNLMGMMGGGMMKKPMSSYQDGGAVGMLTNLISRLQNFTPQSPEPSMPAGESSIQSSAMTDAPLDESQMADVPMVDMDQVLRKKLGMSFSNYADAIKSRNKRLREEYGSLDNAYDLLREGKISRDDVFRERDAFKEFGSGAGLLMPRQEGGMIGPPPPPMDDPLQIGMRQASPEMYAGQTLGGMSAEEALEQGIMQSQMMKNQAIEDSAMQSLQLLRLRAMMADSSMAEPSSESKMEMMMSDPSMQQFLNGVSLDSLINAQMQSEGMQMPIINRDMGEMLNMEMMKRGREALMRGMMREGQEDPLEALR